MALDHGLVASSKNSTGRWDAVRITHAKATQENGNIWRENIRRVERRSPFYFRSCLLCLIILLLFFLLCSRSGTRPRGKSRSPMNESVYRIHIYSGIFLFFFTVIIFSFHFGYFFNLYLKISSLLASIHQIWYLFYLYVLSVSLYFALLFFLLSFIFFYCFFLTPRKLTF